MLYSCINTATVGVRGLNGSKQYNKPLSNI